MERELQERFSFFVPNHRFNPKVKAGEWDGKIRLVNLAKKTIYKGLEAQLEKYCKDNDIEFESDLNTSGYPVTDEELRDFFKENIDPKFEIRPYQFDTIKYAIQNKRATFLSATSSGKSLMIYAIARFWDRKTLLIVPTVGLVRQMAGDFKDYAGDLWDADSNISMIAEGASTDNLNQIVISTWQGIYKKLKDDPKWFKQFDVIFGDECHGAKAASIKGILELVTECEYRYGFTGTLDGDECNELVVEGLFGKIVNVIRTHEMIEQGYSAKVKIKCIQFEYSQETRKALAKAKKPKGPDDKKTKSYNVEIEFINQHERRLAFIIKLAMSLKGNTLVLFRRVETHGKILNEMAQSLNKGTHDVHYIVGKVKVDSREEIRAAMEKREKPQILFASEGTTSTGTNIKNIDNIIFASPNKGRVKVLQSIGRGVRKSETKTEMTLFDLSDDLRTIRGTENHTYKHFLERLKMYVSEQFPYTVHKIRLEND